MIVATVVLGVAAIFIGWRLQTQVNTNSFASCTCPSGYQGPDQYNKCWSESQIGATITATCSDATQTSTTTSAAGGSCIAYCCYPGNQGCTRTASGNVGAGDAGCPGLVVTNSGGVDGSSCPADGGVGQPGNTTNCLNGACNNNPTACAAASGCYNTTTKVCLTNGTTWCSGGETGSPYGTSKCNAGTVQNLGANYTGSGACRAGFCPAGSCLDRAPTVNGSPNPRFNQCIAAGSANCNSSASGSGNDCQICDCTDTGVLDYQGRECRRNCTGYNRACNSAIPACGQLDFPPNGANNIVVATGCSSFSSSTTSSSTTSITTQNTCYKCTDSEDDGNACQTQTTTGTCASLGAGWTTNSSCATAATGGSCTAAIQAKVSGRVYCQDPGGIIIPIPNTVVAITKGTTVVNATTDGDGFYVSSAIGLPSAGDKVAVDISTLPSTFNNGLNTTQLTGKSALNCATTSKLTGCSTGVASNYYCDNVTTKDSYANCKLTTAGDATSGHGYFDFKYTNCSAAVPTCGNSVVDSGEACDPVGTVGQCTNGGKCQTGCACSTCNSACSTNDDCPDGLICSGNSCRNPSNTSAVDCKVRVIPSTGILDGNYLLIFMSFILMVLGLLTVRNQGAISLMTNVAVSLFGTNILRYVDPTGAKRYYEKNILNKQKNEVK